jgi:hypothetical protein
VSFRVREQGKDDLPRNFGAGHDGLAAHLFHFGKIRGDIIHFDIERDVAGALIGFAEPRLTSYPGMGISPSCCSTPTWSNTPQCSTILPLAMRKMEMPDTL